MSLAHCCGLLLTFLARLITGIQGHWKGCPPANEQRLYFANHQSHFDWVLIWASLPADLRATTRPIAARDYWCRSPLRRWLAEQVFNAVFVARTRAHPDEDPLEPLIQALHSGDSLAIFPEGTRASQAEPLEFKAGLFHLAEQFPDLPLIPTWIDNVQRVMPKGELLPVPVLCTVTFGAPLQREPGEDKRDFLARARRELMALRPGGWSA
ncbi:lysophospholipid acyltransferase family protein [Roseateles sp. BYS180W]|uniref:Lysophospholipid acyltransferase family protein n=1 Tax=Roseateles rivi TaxID=3299028 RepID=A0ABW7FRQ1_9BURK